jgi:ABC-type multidrug transport system fused ATPase/permease subunit
MHLLISESAWLVLLVAPCAEALTVVLRTDRATCHAVVRQAVHARCCAGSKPDGGTSGGFKGFGEAPRGFGMGGSSLDELDDWVDEMDAEDADDGVQLSSELRAKRNRILNRWADFVRTGAGGGRAKAPTVAALRNVSLGFGEERILYEVSWEVKEGQVVGVVGESGCGKSTQLRLLSGMPPCALRAPARGGARQHARAGARR